MIFYNIYSVGVNSVLYFKIRLTDHGTGVF